MNHTQYSIEAFDYCNVLYTLYNVMVSVMVLMHFLASYVLFSYVKRIFSFTKFRKFLGIRNLNYSQKMATHTFKALSASPSESPAHGESLD